MGHEISQFDIPDRQLLATNTQPRMGMMEDIGVAKITQTIFGRAKVRIIRKRDKERRTWLLSALAVTVVAAAAWQGWVASQQSEPRAPRLSATVRVTVPAFQPEFISSPVTPPSMRSKPAAPTQTEINNPVASQNSVAQPLPVLKAMATKPAIAQPLITSKLPTAPLATSNNSLKNQTGMPQPPKSPANIQPVAPTVTAPLTTQPAASSPVVVAPLAEPLIVKDNLALSPAGDIQPPDPVNTQP